jgi:hypothetical protein
MALPHSSLQPSLRYCLLFVILCWSSVCQVSFEASASGISSIFQRDLCVRVPGQSSWFCQMLLFILFRRNRAYDNRIIASSYLNQCQVANIWWWLCSLPPNSAYRLLASYPIFQTNCKGWRSSTLTCTSRLRTISRSVAASDANASVVRNFSSSARNLAARTGRYPRSVFVCPPVSGGVSVQRII